MTTVVSSTARLWGTVSELVIDDLSIVVYLENLFKVGSLVGKGIGHLRYKLLDRRNRAALMRERSKRIINELCFTSVTLCRINFPWCRDDWVREHQFNGLSSTVGTQHVLVVTDHRLFIGKNVASVIRRERPIVWKRRSNLTLWRIAIQVVNFDNRCRLWNAVSHYWFINRHTKPL